MLVVGCALPAPLAAELATYSVKFRFDGATGVYFADPPGCPATSRNGFDEFEGKLTGDESGFATDQEVVYRGTMKRKTEIDACDLLPPDRNGVSKYCNVHLEGGGEYSVELSVYDMRTEVYFQAKPKRGKVTYTAGGSCEGDIVSDYKRMFEEDEEGIEHWIGQRNYPRGAKVGGPPRAGIYRDQPPYPPHVGGHWTMTVGARDELRADAGGPYTVERGRQLTLDGSRSTAASGHQIVDYSWEVTPLGTPEGCANMGSVTVLSGVRVSFVALCSVQAKLTVRQDDQKQDTDEATATVSPRAWKTTFTTASQVDCTKSFSFVGGPGVMTAFAFGFNRCSRKEDDGTEHFDTDQNHWYEPAAGSLTDFEEGTYWLEEVTDDGPFAGLFYVSRGDFDIQRGRWVNQKLCKNGSVYVMNRGGARTVESWPARRPGCKFGLAQMDRLLRSIEKHELIHSDLAEAALRKLKDPAIEIEQSLGTKRTDLKDRVNLLVAQAVTAMHEATLEDLVKAVMRGIPDFRDGACFDFPAWDGALRAEACFYEFPSLADKVQ